VTTSSPIDARSGFVAIRDEVGKAVVGQAGVLSGMLCALLAGGHVLLEGVPGVAKTLLVKSVAAAMSLDNTRRSLRHRGIVGSPRTESRR
jgi:MoxR-like ATPase